MRTSVTFAILSVGDMTTRIKGMRGLIVLQMAIYLRAVRPFRA
jgi:hypothetical protein